MSTHLAAVEVLENREESPDSVSDSARLSRRPRLASFLLPAGIAIVGALLAFFRVPEVSRRTVWAEDGRVFLHEYLGQGPALLAPYDGYLHLLPRFLVAVTAQLFGVQAYAVALTAACSVVMGLIAALTFYCSSALTNNMTARVAWASIPVLAAPGALETLGNAANLHWYLLWLMPWLLLKAPDTFGQKVLLGSAALIAALSEIQTILFLPLLFWRPKDRRLWWPKAGFVIGAACQLTTLFMFPREREGMGQDWDILSVVYGYFLNSSSAIAFGSSSAIANIIQSFGPAPIILSAIPFAAVIVALALLTKGTLRIAGLTWLLSSAVVWTAAMVINPAPYFKYSEFSTVESWSGFFLSRYSTAPSMFLLALIPLLIAAGSATPAARSSFFGSRRFRAVAAGAFLVLQTIHFFPIDAAGTKGPDWADGVRQAGISCSSDPALESVEIQQEPAGWKTTIRCEDL